MAARDGGERLKVAAELRRVAELTGDPELELEGAGLDRGRPARDRATCEGADIQIAAASKLAEALHRPLYLWWTSGFRCARAQLAGDFEQAERLAQETLAIGQRGQAENAMHYYAQAIFNIRREQGRLDEIEDAVRRFIDLYPAIPAWRAALALLLVELGRDDEARAELEAIDRRADAAARRQLADRASRCWPRCAATLGDARRAEALYEALLALRAARRGGRPRRDLQRRRGSRLLGLLAAAMKRWDAAERHFEDAMRDAREDGHPAVARPDAGRLGGDAARPPRQG